MGKGLLYCEKRDTDCMEIYMGNGACRRNSCVLDDPEYRKKEAAKVRRRNDLMEKERKHRQEERTAAKNIRTQRKTKEDLLREEIERKRERMERLYTKGLTKKADKLSREIGQMERRIKNV